MPTLQEVAGASTALTKIIDHGLAVKVGADGTASIYVADLEERPVGAALGRFSSVQAAVVYYERAGWPPLGPTGSSEKKEEALTMPDTESTTTTDVLPSLKRGEGSLAVAEYTAKHKGVIDLDGLAEWMMARWSTNPNAVRQLVHHLVAKGFAAWTSDTTAVEVKGQVQRYAEALREYGPNKALAQMMGQGHHQKAPEPEPDPVPSYPTLDELDQIGFAQDGRPVAVDPDGGIWAVVLERI